MSARSGVPTTKMRCSIVAFALVAVIAACSKEKSDRGPAENGTESNQGGTQQASSTGQDFHWPSDTHHPVLQLEIATQNRRGTIDIELMPELAPKSVRRIIELVTNGYYDATTFHRVIPGFMIQGGDPKSRDRDPSNDGRGGADNDLPDEISAARFDRGVVALANRGRENSNSSQFFIMLTDHPEMKGLYTVLGRVIRGIDLVDEIAATSTDTVGRWGPKDRPMEDVQIQRATVQSPAPDPQGIESDPPGAPHRQEANPDRAETSLTN